MKILMVVYDNGSYINWPPQGLAYIAAYLEKEHDITVYQQDIYHYPEEHLTNYLNENNFDIVCLGVIAGYYQYQKLLKISEAINKSKNKPIYIIGGHGPNPDPKYFLEKTKADFIVIGEGEYTMECLLHALENDIYVKNVDGIAYLEEGKLVITEERTPLKNIDFLPAWHYFDINYYALTRQPGFSISDRLMPVLSGRGCPYTCNFCYRMVKGYRARSIDSIISEIKYLKKAYNINAIDFSDELLMVTKKRTKYLCEAFIKNNLNIKWSCNGRLNFADYDILKLMKDSGCVFINYGIECMDDKILKIMNKNLTVDKIIKGVENTIKASIIPGLNIIFGNINEDKDTLKKGVDFLKKYNKGEQLRTIRPVTPYPGSPLYYYAIEKGLIKDIGDFYENKHINSDLLTVNFTKLSDEEFYQSLLHANIELIRDYYTKNLQICKEQTMDLYNNKNANFRGFRQI